MAKDISFHAQVIAELVGDHANRAFMDAGSSARLPGQQCQPPLPQGARHPIASKLAFGVAAVFCLTPWASPIIALLLGAVLSLTVCDPLGEAGQRRTELLLQGCLILLGFGMSLPIVLHTGATGLIFAAITIVVTLSLGFLLGKLLGIHPRESALISVGTAICGGSAIAALGSAVDSDKEDKTVALGVVFLLNTAALYLFPLIGHALHLSEHQFGMWAGVAVHDVSSVVGVADGYGPGALQVATAVKLSRVVWIVPLVLGVGGVVGRGSVKNEKAEFPGNPRQPHRGKVRWPWFIGVFLLAVCCRWLFPGIATATPRLTRVGIAGMVLTLFLMGSTISRQTLKAIGWKPLVHGITLWLFISVVSLLVIQRL